MHFLNLWRWLENFSLALCYFIMITHTMVENIGFSAVCTTEKHLWLISELGKCTVMPFPTNLVSNPLQERPRSPALNPGAQLGHMWGSWSQEGCLILICLPFLTGEGDNDGTHITWLLIINTWDSAKPTTFFFFFYLGFYFVGGLHLHGSLLC